MKKFTFDAKKCAMIIAALATLVLLPYGCNTYYCWHYRRQAEPLISTIEQYKKTTGKVPRSSAEIGYDENQFVAGPFYQAIDSVTYQVFYVDEFNQFYTYSSSTCEWSSNMPTASK